MATVSAVDLPVGGLVLDACAAPGGKASQLASAVGEDGFVQAGGGDTEIFLYPPYKMKVVDGLITNFHLPESTLIMLVACLTGREEILGVYNYAVENEYRFFSFGDACLIL